MVTRRQFLSLTGGAAVVVAAGVAGFTLLPGDEEQTGTPEIKLGKQQCARCGMVIADGRFASAWRDADGKARVFDDPGCMLLDQIEIQPGEGTGYWVAEYRDETFIDATTAAYVVSDAIRSPMAYGIAAFATRAAADGALTELGGTVADWRGVLQQMEGRAS
ncbi:MAG TPA: nitrous oxide reductase accessory protein NosL [Tepidiformaceae bacterium]|nr:nitrous oxide reductase accessory protein NosL [Tepidiformaceae bacterium]